MRGKITDALHEVLHAFLRATRSYLSQYFPLRKIYEEKVAERQINTNFTSINFLRILGQLHKSAGTCQKFFLAYFQNSPSPLLMTVL
jgi:hypothetical protein